MQVVIFCNSLRKRQNWSARTQNFTQHAVSNEHCGISLLHQPQSVLVAPSWVALWVEGFIPKGRNLIKCYRRHYNGGFCLPQCPVQVRRTCHSVWAAGSAVISSWMGVVPLDSWTRYSLTWLLTHIESTKAAKTQEVVFLSFIVRDIIIFSSLFAVLLFYNSFWNRGTVPLQLSVKYT